MIKQLVYKETRLNLSLLYFFLAFPLLLLLPAWPFYIAMAYLLMAMALTVTLDKTKNDLMFSVLLPVRRSDIVTARTIVFAGAELVSVVFGLVCAWLHVLIVAGSNGAAMNPNLAFFGTAFVMYAIFNAFFISGVYKAPYRLLQPTLCGIGISVVVVGLLDTLPLLVPGLARFNGRGLEKWQYQLPVFIVGLAIWLAATAWARHLAVANFDKVDL